MVKLTTDEKDRAKRHKFVTALVAVVEHLGNIESKYASQTDHLLMDLVEAAEITHEEFQAAHAELQARSQLRPGMH